MGRCYKRFSLVCSEALSLLCFEFPKLIHPVFWNFNQPPALSVDSYPWGTGSHISLLWVCKQQKYLFPGKDCIPRMVSRPKEAAPGREHAGHGSQNRSGHKRLCTVLSSVTRHWSPRELAKDVSNVRAHISGWGWTVFSLHGPVPHPSRIKWPSLLVEWPIQKACLPGFRTRTGTVHAGEVRLLWIKEGTHSWSGAKSLMFLWFPSGVVRDCFSSHLSSFPLHLATNCLIIKTEVRPNRYPRAPCNLYFRVPFPPLFLRSHPYTHIFRLPPAPVSLSPGAGFSCGPTHRTSLHITVSALEC